MKYFRFKNWSRYQHYHDRNPPWVKLYTSILDPESGWLKLTDAECGVLAKLLALAARTGNAMPYNPDVIREEISASGPVDLDRMLRLEMFEVFDSRLECAAAEQVRVTALKGASKPASRNASKSASENARLREERGELLNPSDTSAKAAEEVALDPKAESAAHLLRGLILENDSRAKVPSPDTGQWRTWVQHTHMIHRIDGRDWQEIDRVIRWCQSDPFWKSNILSPAKLRKQFTTLMLKSQGGRRMEGFNERYA